jgi:DNA-binding NtrC family response regulator
VEKISYDFVITDVKMPGGSGVELYKKLCQVNPDYRRRTIFITGDMSNPATIQFLEQEHLPYFSKPFDFQALDRHFTKLVTPT